MKSCKTRVTGNIERFLMFKSVTFCWCVLTALCLNGKEILSRLSLFASAYRHLKPLCCRVSRTLSNATYIRESKHNQSKAVISNLLKQCSTLDIDSVQNRYVLNSLSKSLGSHTFEVKCQALSRGKYNEDDDNKMMVKHNKQPWICSWHRLLLPTPLADSKSLWHCKKPSPKVSKKHKIRANF